METEIAVQDWLEMSQSDLSAYYTGKVRGETDRNFFPYSKNNQTSSKFYLAGYRFGFSLRMPKNGDEK